MMDALEEHKSGIKCGGMEISNLRFADDIDLLASTEEELTNLTNKVNNEVNRYGMEISASKSKIMVTGAVSIDLTQPIKVNGKHLEQVRSVKYLGSIITEDGTSDKEISARIVIATSVLANMNNLWSEKKLNIKIKIDLMRAIVLSTMLYGSETWTLNTKMEKRIEAFDMKCLRRVLGISWKEKKTNEFVREEIGKKYGKLKTLLSIVKTRKLKWFGHLSRMEGTMANTVMQGAVEGRRERGRPRRMWYDDIKSWTGMETEELKNKVKNRRDWKEEVKTWVHQRPHWLRNR